MSSISEPPNKTQGKNQPEVHSVWGLIYVLFTRHGGRTAIALLAILTLLVVMTFTGYLHITDGKVSVGLKENTVASEPSDKHSTVTKADDERSFCISEGNRLGKSYVLPSVVQSFDFQLIGNRKDTLLVKERITYDVLALKDITQAQDVFEESYSTNSAFKVEPWSGTDHEEPLYSGKLLRYNVHFNCKSGEEKTIVTGADFYYHLPLADNRDAVYQHLKLRSNEDLRYYPNKEDVIGRLTIVGGSNAVQFQSLSDDARHTITKGGSVMEDKKDSFHNKSQNAESTNNSVSYSWSKLLPDEQCAIFLKW